MPAAPSRSPGHAKPVRFLGVTNDSRYLFTAGDGNLMFRWDLKNAQPQTTSIMLRDHDKPVSAMAVSADGSVLATGSNDGSIRVWDPTSSPPTSKLTRAHDGKITDLAANGDGSLIASVSEDMRGAVWPISGGAAGRRRPLDGHEVGVLSVALSRDGQWVLTGAADGTAKLWNATRRLPALGHFTFLGHEGPSRTFRSHPTARLRSPPRTTRRSGFGSSRRRTRRCRARRSISTRLRLPR